MALMKRKLLVVQVVQKACSDTLRQAVCKEHPPVYYPKMVSPAEAQEPESRLKEQYSMHRSLADIPWQELYLACYEDRFIEPS